MNFRAGDVISHKYRVERVLGEGGMGVVIAAMHLELGQRVAIKFMREEILDQPDIKARFMREARAVAKLRSAHTARVHDVTEPEDGDGPPYIVMEYLEGQDLSSLLKKKGPLPTSDVAEYMLQACEALSEAHAEGIVHRDLKPANLFLTEGPGGRALVKVLDFGVSKLMDHAWDEGEGGGGAPRDRKHKQKQKQDRTVLTRMNDFLGSLNYMSPEQVKSAKDVDSQTDIWALGVIMYRLVSGKLPFTGGSDDELIAKIMRGVVTPLSELTFVSTEFEAVVARCLERDRRRRFRSVEALAHELAPLAMGVKTPSLERIALLKAAGYTPSSLAVRAIVDTPPRSQRSGGLVSPDWGTSSVRTLATDLRRAVVSFATQATSPNVRRKTVLYLVVIVVSLFIMGGAVARFGSDDTPSLPSRHDTPDMPGLTPPELIRSAPPRVERPLLPIDAGPRVDPPPERPAVATPPTPTTPTPSRPVIVVPPRPRQPVYVPPQPPPQPPPVIDHGIPPSRE